MGNKHNKNNNQKYNIPFNYTLNNEINCKIKKRVNLTPNKINKSQYKNDCMSTNSALTTYKSKKIKNRNKSKKIKINNIIALISQIYNNNIFIEINKLTDISLYSSVFNNKIRLKNKKNKKKFINLDTSSSMIIPFDILPINKNDISESLFMSPEEIFDFNNICTNDNIKNKDLNLRKTQKQFQNINLENIQTINQQTNYKINNKNNYIRSTVKFNTSNNHKLFIEENSNIKEIKYYEPNDSNKTYIEIIDALNNKKPKDNDKNNLKKKNSNSSDKKVSKGELYKKKKLSIINKNNIINPFNLNLAMDTQKLIYKKQSNLNEKKKTFY